MNLQGLTDPVFEPLPLGSIEPDGWLRQQLRIQADGLSGHIDDFWPDVAQSGWIGGKAEGWERGPYWLDGFVPLAFLLQDESLKTKAHRWMDYILTHQHPDGWIGPVRDEARGYRACDPWPVSVFLKAATQYHEVTGDPRVPAAMGRFFRRLDRLLDRQMLFDWNRMRWPDLALSLYWLYDRTREPWLLPLATRLRRQGFDWLRQTRELPFPRRTETGRWSYESHVVNYAMAMKQPGVCYRLTADPEDRDGAAFMMDTLDRYHGQATGIFTGDENLAGLSPAQGTELCAVVEYLFSLEVLMSILGDPRFGDRLERIAFNALPATFKPDMWAHQYDQQANQVVCRVAADRVYTTNGPNANLFGLEPNYGCCTANMHQGWPKFASHLWMKSGDRGLAAVAYAPCSLRTEIGGQPVTVTVRTDYPFDGRIALVVTTAAATRFPLRLRIPSWAAGATVAAGEGPPRKAKPGSFHTVTRVWSGTTPVLLDLPLRLRGERRFRGSLVIHRGPLVFSLKVGEAWKPVGGEHPRADWEVLPTTPWNYALQVRDDALEADVQVKTRPLGDCPFSPDGAPVMLEVMGRQVSGWGIERNAAAPPPDSPVFVTTPLDKLTLIPYGCTNLRVTEIPTLP